MTSEHQPSVELSTENARLRTRVEQLELEIAELRASTTATLASAQETLYWFERWGVDFNSLFSRPQVEQARRAFRALRGVYRRTVQFKRRITG